MKVCVGESMLTGVSAATTAAAAGIAASSATAGSNPPPFLRCSVPSKVARRRMFFGLKLNLMRATVELTVSLREQRENMIRTVAALSACLLVRVHGCDDQHDSCGTWAAAGECSSNPG